MTAGAHEPVTERIRALERRLEHRRARLREDVDETRDALHVGARRWLPVAAAAGAGLFALWLMRRGPGTPGRGGAHATGVAATSDRRRVRWASLLGLVTTAYRFGASPQARHVLDVLRRGDPARRSTR